MITTLTIDETTLSSEPLAEALAAGDYSRETLRHALLVRPVE